MKLSNNSIISVDFLIGALITNEHGSEFKCHGLALNIFKTKKLQNEIELILQVQRYDAEGELEEGIIGVPIANLRDWTVQLQPILTND